MYRLAANITEYHIILKLILQRITVTKFLIRQFFHVKVFQLIEKKLVEINPYQVNWTFVVQRVIRSKI